VIAGILAIVVSLEQLCLGGDSYFLGAVFAPLNIAAALAALLVLRPRWPFWKAGWPVLLALALAVAWLAQPFVAPKLLPSHTATMLVPDLALNGICRMLGDIALMLAAAWLAFAPNGTRRVIDLLIVGGVLCIAIGAVIQAIEPGQVWGEIKVLQGSRFSGTLANSNVAGCLFAMLAVLTSGRAEERWRGLSPTGAGLGDWLQVYFTAASAAVAVGACAMSQSRTAFVALLVGLALVLVPVSGGRLRYWTGRALFVAVLGAGLVWLALSSGLSERFVTIQSDLHGRLAIWWHFLALTRKAPWTGYGPLAFDAVNAKGWADLHQAIDLSYIHSPHNLILSIMLIGGLPYLALLSAALVIICVSVARSRLPQGRSTLLRALVASLLILGTCSLTDIGADVPAAASLGSVMLGLLWGRGINSRVQQAESI
jgi:O-antigen ligase